jgi:hypothetical protein
LKSITEMDRVRQPSVEEFRERYLLPQRPVVIEGAIETWKALAEWSPESFTRRHGEQHVRVVRIGKADRGQFGANLRQDEIRVADYMALFSAPGDEAPEISMGGVAVREFPGLLDDLEYPIYIDKPGVSPFFWIGIRGAKTKLHYDLQDNLHLLITGRKRVYLADRRQLKNLYPIPLLVPRWYLHPLRPFNVNRIKSRVDIEHPDYDAFPRLRNVELLETTLERGEMLFIPSCWWHELHNVESSIAINYWWRGEPSAPEFRRAMRYAQWQRFIGGVRRRIPSGGKRDI